MQLLHHTQELLLKPKHSRHHHAEQCGRRYALYRAFLILLQHTPQTTCNISPLPSFNEMALVIASHPFLGQLIVGCGHSHGKQHVLSLEWSYLRTVYSESIFEMKPISPSVMSCPEVLGGNLCTPFMHSCPSALDHAAIVM